MDSEALLPDQTTDGENNSMQIVEEKTIVNEKHLNGKELKNKNAPIAEVVQNATEVNHGDISDSGISISPETYVHRESKDPHESVETEPEAANDQAVLESVVDCSKTPSSASEKEDRSEEVDSCSVAVDVSSTEESTNKRIEIIEEDKIEGFEDKNGELERPLDTAYPAKEVTAANGKLEAFPVESDSANLAGDAEKATELDDKFSISSRELMVEVEEQAVVTTPTESSSATSVIATVEEAKDLEAKFSDLDKEVGVHVEDQVATESDSETLAILNAEETREVDVADDNHEPTANVEEQVPTEETREREAKFEDEKEVYSAIGNVEENQEAELAVDNHKMTTNVEDQVSTELIFAPSAAAAIEEMRETKAKLEDGKELGTTEVEAELTDDNQETTINDGEHVPTESILSTSVGAVAQETGEIEAKFENESDVSSTIVNAEGTIEKEAELMIDGNHETTINVEEQVPTESIFATSTIAVAEETRAIEAKLEDEKKVSSTIANVEGIAEAEAELTNGSYEMTTNVEEHVPTESIFATSVGTFAQETREIEASPTIFNAEGTKEVESQLTDDNHEATINVEGQIPTESIFATSATVISEEMREIEAKLEDENEVSSTIVNAEGSTKAEVGLTDGNHETITNVEEHVPTESIFVASVVAVAEKTREIEDILEDEKKGFSTIVNTEGATEAEVELADDNHETMAHVGEHVPAESIFVTSVGAIAQETREMKTKFEDESNLSSTIVHAEGTTEAEAKLTDDNHEATTNVEKLVQTESIFATSTTEVAEEAREKEAKLEYEKEVSSSIVNAQGTKEAEAEFTGDNHEIMTNIEERGPTELTFATSDIAVAEETREMETNLEDEKEVGTEADLQVPIDSCNATSVIGTANGIVELEAKIADSVDVVANEVEKQVPIESVVDSSSAEIVEESKEIQDRVEQQVLSDSGTATSAIGPFEETNEKEFAVDDHEVPTDVEKQALNEPSDATLAISITEEGRETEAKIDEDGKKEATEIEEIDSSNYITSDAGVAEETEGLVSDHQKVLTAGDKQIQAEETIEIAAKTEDANTEVEHQFSSDFTSSASAPGVAEKTEEIAAKFADNTKKLITEAEKHVATETGGISLTIVTGDEGINSEGKIVDEEKEATVKVQEQVPSDSCISASANEIAEETERLKSKLIEDDGEVPAEVEKQVQSKESTNLGVELGDGRTEIETGAKLDDCKTGIETQVEQQLPSDSTSPTSTTGVTEKSGGIEAELAVNNQEVITESENQIEIAAEISDVSLAAVTADEAGYDEDKIVDDEKATTIKVQEQVPIDSSTVSVNGISEETERLESKHIDDDREVPTEDEKQVPNEVSTEVGVKLDDGVTELEIETEQQFPSDSTCTTSAIGITEKSIEIETELTNDKQEVITEVEKQVASETTNVTLAAVTAGEFRQIEDDEKEAAVKVQEQVSNDSSTSNEFGKFVDDKKRTTMEDETQVLSDSSTCASANGTSEKIENLESKHIDDDQEVPAEAEKQVPKDDSTDIEAKIDNGEIEIKSEVELQLPSDFTGSISTIGIAEKFMEIEAELADDKQKEKTETEKQVASETSDVTLSTVTAEEFRQIEDDEKEAILEIQEQVSSDSSTSNEFKRIYDDEKEAAVEVHEQVPSDSSTSNEFCKFVDDEKEDQEQVLIDSSTCASANGISEETERLESKHIDDDQEVPAEAEKQVSRDESTDVDNGETEVESEVEQQLPSDSSSPTSAIGIVDKSIGIEAELADDKQEEKTEAEKQVASETSDVTLSVVTAEEFRQIEDDEKEAAVEVQEQVPSDSSTSNEFGKIEDKEKEVAVEVLEQVPSDSITFASVSGILEETEGLKSKHINDDQEVPIEAEKQVPSNKSIEVGATLEDGETKVETEAEQQFPSDSTSPTSAIEIAKKSVEIVEIEAELGADKLEVKTEAEKQLASEYNDVNLAAVIDKEFRQIEDDEKETAVNVQEQVPSDFSTSNEFSKFMDDEKKTTIEDEAQVLSDSSTCVSAYGISEETERLESKHIDDDQEVPAEAEKQVPRDDSTDVEAKIDDGETEVESEVEQQLPSDFTSPISAMRIAEKSIDIEAELADDKHKEKTEAEKQVASETSDVIFSDVTAEEFRQIEDDKKEAILEVQEQVPSDYITSNEFKKINDEEKEAAVEVYEQVPSDSSTYNEFCKFVDDEKETTIEDQAQVLSDSTNCASANGISEETERLESKHIDDDQEVFAEVEKQVSRDASTYVDNGETEVEQQLPSDSSSPTSAIGIEEKSLGIEAELADDKQEEKTEAEKQVANETSDVTLSVVTAEEFRQIEDDEKEAAVEVQEQVPSDSSTSNEFGKIEDEEKEAAVEVLEQVSSNSITFASASGISEETEGLKSKHINDDQEVPIEAEKQVPSNKFIEVGAALEDGETKVETEAEQQFPSDSTSPTSAIEIAKKSVEIVVIEAELGGDKLEVKTEAEKQLASEYNDVNLAAVVDKEFRQIEDDEKEAAVDVQEQVPSDFTTSNEFSKFMDDEKKTTIEDEAQVLSDSSTCVSVYGISEETERLESKHIDDDQEVPAEAEKQVPRDDSTDVEAKIDDGETEVESEVEQQLPSDFTSPIAAMRIAEKSTDIEAKLADDKQKEKIEAEKQVASETSDVIFSAVTAEEFRQIEDDNKEAISEVQKHVPSDYITSNELKKINDEEKEEAVEVYGQVPSDSSTSNEFYKFVDDEKETAIEDQAQVLSDSTKHIDDDREVLVEAEKPVSRDESTDVDNGETEGESKVEQQLPSDSSSPTSAIEIAEKSIEIETELADDKQEEKTEAEKQVASETSDGTLSAVTAEAFRQIEDDEKAAVVEVQEQVPSDFSTSNEFEKIQDNEKEAAVDVQEQVPSDSITFASASEILEETEGLKYKHINDDQEEPIEAEKQVPSSKSIEVGITFDDGETKVETEMEQQFPSDSTSPTSVIGIAEKSEEIVEIEAELAGGKLEAKTEAENQVVSENNDVNLAAVSAEEFRKNEDDEKEEIVEVQEQASNDSSTSNELKKIADNEKEVAIEVEEQVPSDSSTSASANGILEETERLNSKDIDDDREVPVEAEKQVPSGKSAEGGAKFDNGDTEVETEEEQQFPSDSISPTSTIGIADKSMDIEAELAYDKQEVITETEKQVAIETGDVTSAAINAEDFKQTEDDEKEAKVEVQENVASDSSTSNEFKKVADDEKGTAAEVEEQAPSDSSTSASANGISEEIERQESGHVNDYREVPTESEKQIPRDASEVGATLDDGKTEVETEAEQQFPSDSTSPTSVIRIAEKSVENEAELADDKQEVKTETERQVAWETSDVSLACGTAKAFKQIEDGEKEAAVEVQEQVPSGSSDSASTSGISKETEKLESKHINNDQEMLAKAEKQVSSEESTEVGAKLDDGETKIETEPQQQFPSDSNSPTLAIGIAEKSMDIEAEFADDKQVANETGHVDDYREVPTESEKQIPGDGSEVGATLDDGKTEVETEAEQQFPSDSTSPTSVIRIAEKSVENEAELADDKQEVKTETERQVAWETSDVSLTCVTAKAFKQIEDGEKEAAVEVQEQVLSGSSASASASGISEETEKLESKHINDDRKMLAKAEKQVPSEESTEVGAKLDDGETEIETEPRQQFLNDSTSPTLAIGIAEKSMDIEAEFAGDKQVANETGDVTLASITAEAFRQIQDDGKEATFVDQKQVPSDSSTSNEFRKIKDEKESAVEVREQVPSDSSTSTSTSGISDETETLEPKAIDDDREVFTEAEEQIPRDESTEVGATLDDGKTDLGTEAEQKFPSDSTSPTSAIGIAEKSVEIEAELAHNKHEVKTEVGKQDTSETSNVTLVVVAAEGFEQIEDDKKEAKVEVEEQIPSDSSSSNEFGKIVDDEKETTIEVQQEDSSDSTTCTSANEIAKETESLEHKLIDDDLGVLAEAEKPIPSEEFIEIGAQIYNGKTEIEIEVEQHFPSDVTSATSAMGIAEKSGQIEAELVDDNQEVEIEAELADDDQEVEIEAELAGDKQEVEIEAEPADGKQEVITKAENQVASEITDVTLAVVTAEEFGKTEAKIEDNEKEAAVEVQEQVLNDSSTSTSAYRNSEDTKKLEAELTNEDQVAQMQIEDVKQIPVEDSTEVTTKVDDGRTEVESEVEKQFPRDSISPSAIQTGEEIREIETEPVNENQRVITVAEKQVASGSLGVALAVVTTADEVGKTEAKIEDDEKEAAGKVREQVQSDFAISTSADKIVEETIKLEPNLIDEDRVVLTEDVKQILVEESTDIGAKVEDGKAELENEVEQQFLIDSVCPISAIEITDKSEIEAELADKIQELITEAENQVATEASDATLADVKAAAMEVQGQVPSDSNISTSVDRIYEEAKNLEPKLTDEDRALLTEAEKQIAIEEFTKIGAKVEDAKAEVESGVEQQFPSDSGTPTSAIGIAVKTREIEAELADENWEMPREVASEINDSTSVICTSDDVRETKAKIEGDEEVVIEVGEQIPINSSTSTDGTTEDAKESVVKLADDNQEAVADVREQGLTESRSDISAAESAEESRKTEAQLEDEKQEAAPEVKKQELNQRNEADAANDIGQVLAEEERDNATFDDTSDNANDTKLKIVDLVKQDADNNHTSIVQTAGKISQATVEAKNEKQDEIAQIEEPSVAEINKIDSGCLIAGVSTREEKPNVIIESVDKEEHILEDKASMDNLNDANVISQVLESTVEEVKDCGNDKMVREIDHHSQTVVKDMDIEMKEDTITLVESSNNLDNDTETNDGFEGKKRSEGLEIVERKKEDILKVDKVILDENSKHSYVPDTTESLTKIEKSPVVVEVIEQNDGEILESSNTSSTMIGREVAEEKCEDSANNNITTDETDKSAGEEGDASKNLPMENKISEGNEEKETKDENVEGTYVKVDKDIDVSKEVATAVTAFDQSLSPKSADLVKVEEEAPKESAPAKSSPRRSNNIISKVKHQIVKAKKAIMGKSSSPKDMASKSNELK